ncbi:MULTISPECIES: pyridoxamine 5'-phosphate oxidase [unclassified Paenibacillus]|uniref:pyridoxamine 5'-phosphate oxidase n=1 Tax=unclassified Paenibacillus TaxID=185978 RepID=UPI003628DB5D
MTTAADHLSQNLVSSLQGEKIVTLITMDDQMLPQLSAVSWVIANQEGTKIKIALGHKASSIQNIQINPNVVLGVIGAGSYYAIKGTASVSDVVELTMKLQVVTVDIESVEDVIFYGGKIITEPAYEKTYNPELAKKLDTEVYALLRQ